MSLQQLTSLDVQFLALETSRQTGHVAGLAVLDPSTAPNGKLGCPEVKALFRERLHLLPPLRRKLAPVPLDLDYPFWVDDRDFDLDFHVREIALPPPGTDEQLAKQVARIVERRLDRTRPLWECYVVHGLPDGQVGVLTKIHHAVIDGVSGAEILGILLDLEPEGREIPPPEPDAAEDDQPPGQLELLARGVLGPAKFPLRVARALPTAVPNAKHARGVFGSIPGATTLGGAVARVRDALRDDLPSTTSERLVAPRTPFNGEISGHRRFAFGRMELADIKAVKNAHACTVIDVVVSICAGAVRRWLREHRALPREPLVTQIPVSVRSEEQIGTYGNRILLMAAPLFTDEEDPVERLHRTHLAMLDMKDEHRALPASLLQDANHFIPPAVFARAARTTFRVSTSRAGRPNWNLVISNVPGPQFPLYMAGARLVANYPVSVITHGMGLNITVMSLCGKLDIGIVADREQMPDVQCLVEWMKEELEALMPAPPTNGHRRGASSRRTTAAKA